MNEAANQFRKHGFYHSKSKFSNKLISDFKQEFDIAFEEKKKRFYKLFSPDSDYKANHDINRWNMLLPSDSLMLSSGFYAIDEIFETLKDVFVGDFALIFFSSDISSPGSAFQTIHQDGNDFAVALNVPLVSSDEENGATHIYPGTHLLYEQASFTNDSNTFTDEEILKRAEKLNPISMNLEVGDYTLRDLRLIHRGTPNKTNIDRPYLSAIFLPSSLNESPSFETIEKGLIAFQDFKTKAFASGRKELIDYANIFGRLVLGFANSDRVKRPIPKLISDNLSENALYCLRFAKFEDQKLNEKIIRNRNTSEALELEISLAIDEFNNLLYG
jgi:ectoine hydroxylase-related dioxygenase (phytanoyl-CoA dioxygenase family)